MAKIKINLSGVKEFLFNHGEKVALGVCGFIAIVLGGLKLLDAAGAGVTETGKSWVVAFTETQKEIIEKMNGATAKPFDAKSIDPDSSKWGPIESKYVSTPYAQVREDNDSKRGNPTALTIDPKTVRLDYIRGMVFAHEYDKAERTVKGAVPTGQKPKEPVEDRLKIGRPQTFVVVHAVFPMKQQVEEFRKALRYATQKELFDSNREDLPWILGINVFRHELTRIGGDPVSKEPELIVNYDPASKRLKLQPALEKLLREAMYDEALPPIFEPYLYEGLAMPLPALAYGRYPRFQGAGWDLAWADDEPEKKEIVMDKQPPDKKGGDFPVIPGGKGKKKLPNPNPQPGVVPDKGVDLDVTTIKDAKLKEADRTLSNRLFGDSDNMDKKIDDDFNVFHVLGKLEKFAEDPKAAIVAPPIKGGRPKKSVKPATDGPKYFFAWDIDPPKPKEIPAKNPKDPPQTVFSPWERDALVRFIDADVKPGKTYSYSIQVRIANPNFGKEGKVVFDALAATTELPLDDQYSWVTTPSITIPQDYFLYAMDQHQFDEWLNPAGAKSEKLPPNATTFQIHQWVAEKPDQVKFDQPPYAIGDWVVVERQVVRKGERIGAEETVRFPVWRPRKETFEVPGTQEDKKKRIPQTIGGRILLKGTEAPVLIDFAGGKRMKPNTIFVEEESAVEALILTFDADGKQRLRVQNSRDDSGAMQPLAQVGVGRSDDPPFQAISRQERWLTTQRRILDLLAPKK